MLIMVLSPLLCPTGVRCALVELRPQVCDPLHLAAPRYGTNFLRQVSVGYAARTIARRAPHPLSIIAEK